MYKKDMGYGFKEVKVGVGCKLINKLCLLENQSNLRKQWKTSSSDYLLHILEPKHLSISVLIYNGCHVGNRFYYTYFCKKAKAKIKNKTKNRVEKTSLMGLKYELKKALHEVSFNHKYFNHEINSEIFKQI